MGKDKEKVDRRKIAVEKVRGFLREMLENRPLHCPLDQEWTPRPREGERRRKGTPTQLKSEPSPSKHLEPEKLEVTQRRHLEFAYRDTGDDDEFPTFRFDATTEAERDSRGECPAALDQPVGSSVSTPPPVPDANTHLDAQEVMRCLRRAQARASSEEAQRALAAAVNDDTDSETEACVSSANDEEAALRTAVVQLEHEIKTLEQDLKRIDQTNVNRALASIAVTNETGEVYHDFFARIQQAIFQQ